MLGLNFEILRIHILVYCYLTHLMCRTATAVNKLIRNYDSESPMKPAFTGT